MENDKLGGLTAAIKKIETSSVEALNSHKEEIVSLRDRVEEIEMRGTRPGLTGEKGETRESREHLSRFTAYLRSPFDSYTKQALGDFQHNTKAMTVGSNPDGGFAVPSEWLREVERLERKFSPHRDLVRVVQVGSTDLKLTVNTGGLDSGWVGEAGPRVETNTPQLQQVEPTFGELYAYPKVSEHARDDVFFPLDSFLQEEVAQEFAIKEAEAVVSGSGSNQPTGLLHSTPTSRDDNDSPIRDNEFEAIDDGDSPHSVTADVLIQLYYLLNSAYRSQSTWIMNSETASFVRLLKTQDLQYVWQQGLQLGQPEMLLGRPVSIWEQMPSVSTGAASYPIALGDWRRAYLLADRVGMRVTVDANITSPGYIKYFFRRRTGGISYNVNAAKFLKSTA